MLLTQCMDAMTDVVGNLRPNFHTWAVTELIKPWTSRSVDEIWHTENQIRMEQLRKSDEKSTEPTTNIRNCHVPVRLLWRRPSGRIEVAAVGWKVGRPVHAPWMSWTVSSPVSKSVCTSRLVPALQFHGLQRTMSMHGPRKDWRVHADGRTFSSEAVLDPQSSKRLAGPHVSDAL